MRRFSLAAMGGSTSSAGTVFLVNEDCEGTGTPSGWTTITGTVNWDYTTIPLEGAQSLYMTVKAAQARTRKDWTDQTEIWVYFLLQGTNGTIAPSAAIDIIQVQGNGGVGSTIGLSLAGTSKFRVGPTTTVANVIAIDTMYHVWWHYLKGTGANAVIDVGFSTNGVRPTSGGNYVQTTTDTATTNAGRIIIGTTGIQSACDFIFDKIRVAATQIGDNGA